MLTWISLELSLNEIIWERTKLFHSTNSNIACPNLLPLIIKLVINLQKNQEWFYCLWLITLIWTKVAYLSRAEYQSSDAFFKIRVIVLILDQSLEPSSLLVKTWVALDIIKLWEVWFAVLVTEQVLWCHYNQRLAEVSVYLHGVCNNIETL